MMAIVPSLVELEILLRSPRDGRRRVGFRLLDRGLHPPVPVPGEVPVVGEDVLQQVEGDFDEALFALASEEGGMALLAEELLTGFVVLLLDELRRDITSPQVTLWEPGARMARLVICADDPVARCLPWERLTLPGEATPLAEQLLFARFRRWSTWPERPLESLEISLEGLAENAGPEDVFVDDHTRTASDMGFVSWEAGPTPEAAIRHVALAPGDTSSLARPAELVVYHLTGPDWLPAEVDRLVARTLDRGARAVLAVGWPGPYEPDPGGFFHALYRKVLHDWPLDRCIARALDEARSAEAEPAGWWFESDPRGVNAVLLSGTLTEMVAMAPAGSADLVEAVGQVAATPRHSEASYLARLRGLWETARELVTLPSGDRGTAVAACLSGIESVGPDDPPEDDPAPVPPRFAQVWTSDEPSEGPPAEAPALSAGEPTWVQVQVAPLLAGAVKASAAFDEDAVAAALAEHGEIELSVAIFAPRSALELLEPPGPLRLPRRGPSTVSAARIRPLKGGSLQLRVGLFYENHLVQSVVVRLGVDGEGAAEARVDWASDLSPLEREQQRPASLSLWVNDGPDGTHWVGAYSADRAELGSGRTWECTAAELDKRAQAIRDRLAEAQGRNSYRYASRQPTADDWEERQRRICELAAAGCRLVDDLYDGMGLSMDDSDAIAQAGHISIARCRRLSADLPWAALYDYLVDPELPLQLCPRLLEDLAAGDDMLDRPQDCRARDGCPLSDEDTAETTVCPFGFWGLRGTLEQPILMVTPVEAGSVPPELQAEGPQHVLVLPRPAEGTGRLLVGWNPDIATARVHLDELRSAAPDGLTVDDESDRSAFLGELKRYSGQVVYLYCHGVEQDDELSLQLGPPEGVRVISSASISSRRQRLTGRALVVLNACESVAMRADRVGSLLESFRAIGASGVIGSQIQVSTALARPFGSNVMRAFLRGERLGDAVLAERRRLMRALNPLGLAYSVYAPADLHIDE